MSDSDQIKEVLEEEEEDPGQLAETIKTVIYAVVIAFGVRTFAYEPFNIPSRSMVPTLLVGDYLFVSKYSYGYSRYTIAAGYDVFDGRVMFNPGGAEGPGDIRRGDVAVFKKPEWGTGYLPSTDFIKRVVGLPGDHLKVVHGRLWINGAEIPRERVEDFVEHDADGKVTRTTTRYKETLPRAGGGMSHYILEEGDDRQLDNWPQPDEPGKAEHPGWFTADGTEFIVPPGHYFAMGDNRDNSQDSRVLDRVGPVPVENFVGRAVFLFFSVGTDEGECRGAWEFWKWHKCARFGRIFGGVG